MPSAQFPFEVFTELRSDCRHRKTKKKRSLAFIIVHFGIINTETKLRLTTLAPMEYYRISITDFAWSTVPRILRIKVINSAQLYLYTRKASTNGYSR